jgi:hypothetical protein
MMLHPLLLPSTSRGTRGVRVCLCPPPLRVVVVVVVVVDVVVLFFSIVFLKCGTDDNEYNRQ